MGNSRINRSCMKPRAVIKELPQFGMGHREATTQLKPGERVLIIHEDLMYQFDGDPLDDVLSGDAVLGLHRVAWDNLEQKWMDVGEKQP